MSTRRALFVALTLVAASVPAVTHAGPRVDFRSPRSGDILFGPTTFEFLVEDGDPAIERVDVYAAAVLIGTAEGPRWTFDWTAPADFAATELIAVVYADGTPLETRRIVSSHQSVAVHVDVVSVQLYPVVKNGRRYVADLTEEDFVVLDDGQPAEIQSFERKAVRLNAILVLDASSSMEDKISVLQQASARFIERLDPGDEVSVFEFHHGMHLRVDRTVDHFRARSEVLDVSVGGGTALYDSLALILEQLQAVRYRKVVLLFSDGRDERSLTSLRRTIALARKAEVIVYAVGFVSHKRQASRRNDLRLLASETGGKAYVIDRLADLSRVFNEILEDVKAQYSISFAPHPGEPGPREVEVRTTNPAYTVRCRTSYVHDR